MKTRMSLLTLIITISNPVFALAPATGAGVTSSGSDSASCGSAGLAPKVGQWCGKVKEILADTNTCAGAALQGLNGKPIAKANEICGSDIVTAEQWQAIILSMIEVESSGECGTAGDGGKSQGLLQSTDGDRSKGPQAAKSAQECTGNQKDCMTGLKCGMCLAIDNVAAANSLFTGGSEGLGTMFGPWRSGNASHTKQVDLAKKACSAATGSMPASQYAGRGPAAR
jgi:hypothetical protein